LLITVGNQLELLHLLLLDAMFPIDGSEVSHGDLSAWELNLEQLSSLGKRLACQFRKREVGLDVVYVMLLKSFGLGVSLLLVSLHFLAVAA
jgi:hypothetical protein